ncbi:unnamed protein product [Camellia sinensis]
MRHFQRDRLQEMCKTLRVLMLYATMILTSLLVFNSTREVVIMHWACAKITASLAIPDVTLLEILLDELKICKSISYAAVAAHADKSG